jgi:CHAT domain-containing protein
MLSCRVAFALACVVAGLLFVDPTERASNNAAAQSRTAPERVDAGLPPSSAEGKVVPSADELASTDFLLLFGATDLARQKGDYPHALALYQRIVELCVKDGQLSEICGIDARLESSQLRQAFQELTGTLMLLGRSDDAVNAAVDLTAVIGRSQVPPGPWELSDQWSNEIDRLAASLDANGRSSTASLLRLSAANMVGDRLRFLAQTLSDSSLDDLIEKTATRLVVYGSSPDARQLFMDLLAILLKRANGSQAALFSTEATLLSSQVSRLFGAFSSADLHELIFPSTKDKENEEWPAVDDLLSDLAQFPMTDWCNRLREIATTALVKLDCASEAPLPAAFQSPIRVVAGLDRLAADPDIARVIERFDAELIPLSPALEQKIAELADKRGMDAVRAAAWGALDRVRPRGLDALVTTAAALVQLRRLDALVEDQILWGFNRGADDFLPSALANEIGPKAISNQFELWRFFEGVAPVLTTFLSVRSPQDRRLLSLRLMSAADFSWRPWLGELFVPDIAGTLIRAAKDISSGGSDFVYDGATDLVVVLETTNRVQPGKPPRSPIDSGLAEMSAATQAKLGPTNPIADLIRLYPHASDDRLKAGQDAVDALTRLFSSPRFALLANMPTELTADALAERLLAERIAWFQQRWNVSTARVPISSTWTDFDSALGDSATSGDRLAQIFSSALMEDARNGRFEQARARLEQVIPLRNGIIGGDSRLAIPRLVKLAVADPNGGAIFGYNCTIESADESGQSKNDALQAADLKACGQLGAARILRYLIATRAEAGLNSLTRNTYDNLFKGIDFAVLANLAGIDGAIDEQLAANVLEIFDARRRNRTASVIADLRAAAESKSFAGYPAARARWAEFSRQLAAAEQLQNVSQTEVQVLRARVDQSWLQLSQLSQPPGQEPRSAAAVQDFMQRIRLAVGADESLVAYFLGGDNANPTSVAIIVRQERIAMVRLPSSGLDVRGATRKLREGLDPGIIGLGGGLPDVSTDLAYSFYLALVKPLEKELFGTKALVMVPDPTMAGLPLSVLISEPPQEKTWNVTSTWRPHWLVDRFAITMAPSAEAVAFLRGQQRSDAPPNSMLAFGDPVLSDALRAKFKPLPDAGLEARKVAALASDSAQASLIGKDFTKDRIKHQRLSGFRVILFATHAVPAHGIDPAFILATPPATVSEQDDGAITATDIAGLRIDSDLIILSACNTGVGDGDEDGYGELVGAFFLAGAGDVIASNWPVVSDTAENITVPVSAHVARSGLTGLSTALQKSMQQLSERPPGDHARHPISWAPFFIVGAPPL